MSVSGPRKSETSPRPRKSQAAEQNYRTPQQREVKERVARLLRVHYFVIGTYLASWTGPCPETISRLA